mmetsp:Transcript_24560/g.36164  ORF Transcript_24560/g.36164 Transcript_24560/m.36164 type:complete len:1432 (-) Transcript_24560:98-4393(-)
MTHYDGKSSYFHERKSVINREPLYVNKKLYQESIENLYKVHRQRVVNAQPRTDTKMKVYDFLENQAWKRQTQQLKALELLKHNEIIYSRINKVETTDSRILCEMKDHMRKISVGTQHMKRLKAIARQRGVDKIQRENMYMKERLAKIKPYYSKKLFDDSFEHHKTFMRGRRTDNTAGHIIDCPKKLRSGPLPPVHPSLALGSTLPQRTHPSLLSKTSPMGSMRSASAAQLSTTNSVASTSDSVSLLEVPPKLRSSLSRAGATRDEDESEEKVEEETTVKEDDQSEELDNFDDEVEVSAASLLGKPVIRGDEKSLRPSLSKSRSIIIEDDSDELAESYFMLATRPVPVLGDTCNCTLRVYTSKDYDETIVLRALTAFEPYKVLGERRITLDMAYDNINTANMKPTTTEDLQSLRGMLVTMFQEADTENNGYLTYDEFQGLMERIEVGISAQELRFVIAEADENENGFIDYHEFVPLAVDMIQAFRARTRAKSSQELLESAVEDEVLHKVNREEVQRIAVAFFEHVKQFDIRGSGALRPSELRKCLKSVSQSSGLTNSEINMIAQSLPKDPFGRLVYKDFRNILYKVKIAAMRNMVLESQGNDIHRYLMQLCRDEERQLLNQDMDMRTGFSVDKDDDSILTGWLPLRSLINIMISSPRLSLSRLQVMVIASEAEVVDGKVNYLHFAPVAAKTIELMFEPRALRQRAELIETSDLSPEVLLNGTSPEVFVSRLQSLFKSYDIDKKGELNAKQFRAMLESMDLQLSPGEILSLMAIADYNNNGAISFDEFCEFCMNNLLHLEREKHIRLLQRAIHGTVESTEKELDKSEIKSFEKHLKSIFTLADKDGSGSLEYPELEALFMSLDIHLSQFQLFILMSECDTNGDGYVDYEEFIPICVDILEAARAKNHAREEKEKREKLVREKVLSLSASWEDEVRNAADNFVREFEIIETIANEDVQRSMLVEAAKNPRNGLNRTEANIFIAEILRDRHKKGRSLIESLAEKTLHANATDTTSRYNKTATEIYHIIKNIRMASLMRGMLEEVEPSALAKHLLARFADEAEQLRIERNSSEPVFFLPVKNVVRVLESISQLRLHIAQIMTLISWADSFQSPGIGIDYREFAYYSADLIAKMYDSNEMQKRAKVLSGSSVDGNSAMKGAGREAIETFLTKELSSAVSTDGLVSHDVLHDVLKSIPRLQLSDREVAAVIASAQCDEDGMYDWRAFLPWAYGSIRAVCMERMIGRRVTLMRAQSVDEKDHVDLVKLGESLIDITSVRKIGGNYSISFVCESTKQPRRSSLLTVRPKNSEGESRMVVDESSLTEQKTNDTPQESFDILRTGVFLPLRGPSKDPRLTNGVFVVLRVSENDPILCFDLPPLQATALTSDSRYSMTLPLNLRLPSLGLVDQEAAEQFALNLVRRMYVSFDKKDNLTLNIDI